MNKTISLLTVLTLSTISLSGQAATYEPIEFNSKADYGSTQWQIDRANWNIINNNKYSTYQVQVETENRVNYNKYIESKLTTEQNNRINYDKYLENKIEQNRTGLNTARTEIKTNRDNIKVNAEDIARLRTLTGAQVTNLGNQLQRTNQRIDKLDNKLEGGLATVTALTQLHPNPRYQGKTQVSIGTGMYADNIAGAVGIFHYFNDRIMMNASASYGGDSQWAGGIGISIGL